MISIEQLAVRSGEFRLPPVTMQIQPGRCAVLMGRTGSGKTTLIEAICGLRPILGGRVVLDGEDVTQLPPALRRVAYVPQDLALFPTMTVREHLQFALSVRHWNKRETSKRVTELADLLNISSLLDRPPIGLSGGEQQRVALGRALSFPPRILLLDEPLSALDDSTREEMYGLLKQLTRELHVTCLHVTHNWQEARRLADQLYVLLNGQCVELPSTVLQQQQNPLTTIAVS